MEEFDFSLPDKLIALRPVSPRDAARLLVVRKDGSCEHSVMSELPKWLRAGDVLIANDSKVMPAALTASNMSRNGTAIRLNLLRRTSTGVWTALARPAKRLAVGDVLKLCDATTVTIESRSGGETSLRHIAGPEPEALMEQSGSMPLPPYITRRRAPDAKDKNDYQTIFAGNTGSAAAPTAGLHFTRQLLRRLEQVGISMQYLTLHVGAGTFTPIRTDKLDEHKMHEEYCSITPDIAKSVAAARAAGGRCVAVGTTSLRALETMARRGETTGFTGATKLFLRPGDSFMLTDALLTNFHQPRSTLFVLTCALMGTEVMRSAYALAMASGYRFCSYGDACLLLND